MKKFLIALIFTCIFSSISYAAISDEENNYIRKDVFEVYMQNINANFEKIFTKLDNLEQRFDKLEQSVNAMRVDVGRLEERIDAVNTRVSDLSNNVYLWFFFLSVILGFPHVSNYFKERKEQKEKSKQYTTVDVEEIEQIITRLLETKFANKLQG